MHNLLALVLFQGGRMELSIHPAREFSPEEAAAAKEELFEDTLQENSYMWRLLSRWLESTNPLTPAEVRANLAQETYDYLNAK
jgi:hypothetical protein